MTRRKTHYDVVSLADARARRATACTHRTQAIVALEYAKHQLEFNPGADEFGDVVRHITAELAAAIARLRAGYPKGV